MVFVGLYFSEVACDPAQHADLAAVVMQEGLAHLCLVTSSMTLVRAKIDTSIPRKRKGMCSQHDKGLHRFYEQVLQAILRHVDFDSKFGFSFVYGMGWSVFQCISIIPRLSVWKCLTGMPVFCKFTEFRVFYSSEKNVHFLTVSILCSRDFPSLFPWFLSIGTCSIILNYSLLIGLPVAGVGRMGWLGLPSTWFCIFLSLPMRFSV